MSFEDDIKGQNTQLYPIVTIEPPEDMFNTMENHDRVITLSTNNVSLGHIHRLMGNTALNLDSVYFKPLLLNIPSIKESVDVESRKFKISSVNLNISNIEYEGERFTDILSDTSLLNWKVSIQFVSPSVTAYSTIFGVLNYDPVQSFYDRYVDDQDAIMMAKMVYQGIIRRISHDDEKVRVELEDLTEQKTHKSLPSEYLGVDNNVPDKYKNKPIPIVYGGVDKSPCVLRVDGGTYIIPDYREIKNYISEEVDLIDNIIYPLYVSNGNSYANVPKYMLTNSGHANSIGWDLDQYLVGENTDATIVFTTSTKQYVEDESPFSNINCKLLRFQENDLFINNILFTSFLSSSDSFDVLLPPSDWVDDVTDSVAGVTSIMDLSGADFHNLTLDDESFVLFDNQRTYEVGGTGATFNMAMPFLHFKYVVDRSFAFDAEKVTFFFNGTRMDREDNFEIPVGDYSNYDPTHTFTNNDDFFMGEGYIDTGSQLIPSSIQPDFLFQFTTNAGTHLWGQAGPSGNDFVCIKGTDTNAASNNLTPKGFDGFKLGFTNVAFGTFYHPRSITIKVRAKNLDYWRWGISKGTTDKDFYANVNGRINTFVDHPDSSLWPSFVDTGGFFPTTEYELIENPIDIIYDLVRSEIGHENINYDEYEQAKLQHADWRFAFTVNQKISSKKLIEDIAKSTKCFPKFKNDGSFGFNTVKDSYTLNGDYVNATPIKESEVISYSFKKTKPEQIYKKVTVSYHKDYAQDSYLKTAFSEDLGADSYYGIEDSADAHLEFGSDHIRHKETADDLASFLSEQYKNDHLIFNLKLPLQYIDLEIGDLVKFEKLFQGVKAYGINYTALRSVNFQTRYPLFMVTSTTKSLDSLSVECMQLHALGDVDNSDWDDEVIGPEDTTAPVITFGSASLTYTVGDAFVPFTATAVDYTDGELTVDITYSNTMAEEAQLAGSYSEAGSFQVFYESIDSSGNITNASQSVVIEAQEEEEEGEFYNLSGIVQAAGSSYLRITIPNEQNNLDGIIPATYSNGSSVYYLLTLKLNGEVITSLNAPAFGAPNIFRFTHSYLGSQSNPNLYIFYPQEELDTNGDGIGDSLTQFNDQDFPINTNESVDIELQVFTQGAPPFLSGDANADGGLNILDIVLMINFILGQIDFMGDENLEAHTHMVMDMNDDSLINILDIVILMNAILEE